jgi:DNA-binding NarL/FixJ family response regulator
MNIAPKTIVIADDHPIFRVGVVNILQGIGGYKVVAEAENGFEAIELIEKHKPNLAIIDLDMPKCSGICVVNRIVELHLPTRIIILTAHTDPQTFLQVAGMAEVSILLKENTISELPQCLQSIENNEIFISPSSKKIISKFQQKFNSTQRVMDLLESLTPTELIILKLIGEGLTTQQIAERQNNSFKTIENHRSNIAQKLNITGANTLLVFALENKSLVLSALEAIG